LAALLVHSLSSADQRWLFMQLTPDESARLQVLQAELVQLGFPSDRKLLDEALRLSASNSQNTNGVDPVRDASALISDREFFANLSPEHEIALIPVLSTEPPLLVARFLDFQDWAWTSRLLEALPKQQRKKISDLLEESSKNTSIAASGVALGNAMLSALRQRCEHNAKSVPQIVAPLPRRGGISGAWEWFQRLLSSNGATLP